MEYRVCSLDDLSSIVNINKRNYGNEYFVTEEYFKWRFFSKEYDQSFLVGAFNDKKLIGLTGMFIAPYSLSGQTKNVAVTFSSLIEEGYRTTLVRENGKLITLYSKLLLEAESIAKKRLCSAIIGFPNKNSYPTFVEMFEFKHLADVDFFIMPLDFTDLLSIRLRLPRPIASAASKIICKLIGIFTKKIKTLETYTIKGAPDQNVDLNSVSDFFCIRSKNFLDWRFRNSPVDYFTTICKGSDKILGYCSWAVSEIVDRKRNVFMKCIKVADIFIEPEKKNAIEICNSVLHDALETGLKHHASFLILGCKINSMMTNVIKKVFPFHLNKMMFISKKMPIIFKWISNEKEPEFKTMYITMCDNDVV